MMILDKSTPATQVEADEAIAEIDRLTKACSVAVEKIRDEHRKAEVREKRDDELKKLDATAREAQNWPEYVKGLVELQNRQGETTDSDLAARREEVGRRLNELASELERWRHLPATPTRNDQIRRLRNELGALPAHYAEQRERLLAQTDDIRRDFEIRNACDRFDHLGGSTTICRRTWCRARLPGWASSTGKSVLFAAFKP